MAQTNRSIDHDIDTIFFTTELNYAYISSTIAKEVAFYGGDISGFVPEQIIERVQKRVEAQSQGGNK